MKTNMRAIETLTETERLALQRQLDTRPAAELMALGLRMRAATRAYTQSPKQYVKANGILFSHFEGLLLDKGDTQ